jgi:hypothetical protein
MPTNSQRSESQRRVENLAAALLCDRERPTSANTSNECFACGRAYMRRPVSSDDNPRFCSSRCQDAFDAGFPPYDPNHDRPLSKVPLSGWLAAETRYYEPVLRGSKAWRKLGKSAGWTPIHKLKIRPKKPNKVSALQGDFSGPTDPPIGSNWEPSKNIDPNHPDLEIPAFLDRRLWAEADRADAPDGSLEQPRKAAA